MKTQKNRNINFLKISILLFGISFLLSNCEKENLIDQQEISIENRFESLFNKQKFTKTIPFDYQVDWRNPVKQYSTELKTNFYEFHLIYNTPFTPTAVNNSKKEGYNSAYRLIVTENKEKNLTFFIAKFFQKKEGLIPIEKLAISFNNNTGYQGITHLYDENNILYFAKHISKEENKDGKLYFKGKIISKNADLTSKKIVICTTSTIYHYIDWYKYTYDAWGNLISIVFLYTEYVGSSSTTSCITEFQPDEPVRIIKNPIYIPCRDGSGRTDCVKKMEPKIMCEIGFEPEANGKCVKIKKKEKGNLDDKIINKLTNPCAKGIFEELLSGIYTQHPLKSKVQVGLNNILSLNFSELILKLFDGSNSTNYTIQNGATTGSNASTVGATTTMNNSYLQNATKLSIARTMIHEQVHAYFNALYSNVIPLNSFSFQEKMDKYAKDNGFIVGTNRFHHEFMAQFVDAMAYSLYQWDKEYGSGGNLGWNYYKSMAFGGLYYKKRNSNGNYILDSNGNPIIVETDSFKALIPSQTDRNKIKNILLTEQDNTSNAKGTKCN